MAEKKKKLRGARTTAGKRQEIAFAAIKVSILI